MVQGVIKLGCLGVLQDNIGTYQSGARGSKLGISRGVGVVQDDLKLGRQVVMRGKVFKKPSQ